MAFDSNRLDVERAPGAASTDSSPHGRRSMESLLATPPLASGLRCPSRLELFPRLDESSSTSARSVWLLCLRVVDGRGLLLRSIRRHAGLRRAGDGRSERCHRSGVRQADQVAVLIRSRVHSGAIFSSASQLSHALSRPMANDTNRQTARGQQLSPRTLANGSPVSPVPSHRSMARSTVASMLRSVLDCRCAPRWDRQSAVPGRWGGSASIRSAAPMRTACTSPSACTLRSKDGRMADAPPSAGQHHTAGEDGSHTTPTRPQLCANPKPAGGCQHVQRVRTLPHIVDTTDGVALISSLHAVALT
jgi:hypothetical protein